MRSTRLLILLAAGTALAACKDSTPPVTGIGVPTTFDVVSGGSQSAAANTAVPNPIVVKLKDGGGTPLADKTVTITVVAGGGSVSTSSAITDANGQVTLPTWTLGKSHVPQVVRFLSDTAHEDVPATVLTSYHVEVRFWGQAMTPSQQALFTNAAQRIEGFVTGDVEDALAQGIDLNQACGVSGQPTMNETIDDVIIYASIQPIDGAGQILAQSGPCLIRDDPQAILPPFPAVGIMEFDSADLATLSAGGSLQDVITHEMMHVMGFGVIWDISPLDLLDNAGTADPEFNGSAARSACVALGGTSTCAAAVPVEGTPAPAGTADSHWRETTFDAEIMTGYIDSNNPISTMTIGAFADMGYAVNGMDNDTYSLSSLRASARSSSALQTHSWDRVLQPRWLLNPVTGRTRAIQVK